jgi:hypothetical protein
LSSNSESNGLASRSADADSRALAQMMLTECKVHETA